MTVIEQLRSNLIVSCQAPQESVLHDDYIIAKIAQACVNRGAKALRIDSPSHIKAVKKLLPDIPVIGLWKQMGLGSDVYITPRMEDAKAVSGAGAEIIAIDATDRKRPNDEKMAEIVAYIHNHLGKLVMADIDSVHNAIAANKAGVDLIGTTLYGYTEKTQLFHPPSYDLITTLVKTLDTPIICEGGVKTPLQAKEALEAGCFAVVVGTAITGIDLLAESFLRSF